MAGDKPPVSWLVNVIGRGIIVSFLLGLAFVMLSMDLMHIPPFNLAKLERLYPGMPKEAVIKILGEPTHDETDQRIYAGWGWPMVHVYFDADGHYESSEYDY